MTKKQLEKFRKEKEILTRHTTNQMIELGKFYNFPQCCTDQFVAEVRAGINPAQYREAQWGFPVGMIKPGGGYVPCNACMIKYIAEVK